MTYGPIFDYFQYFLTYWSFLCDFTLGMAIWFQVSRVYSWEQPLVWLDWHWLWGWSVNHWLEPILQKMWSTDRLDIQNPVSICKKLKLHVWKLACHSPSTFDYPVVLYPRHFEGVLHLSLFFQKYLLCHPKHLSSVVDEYHFINESFSQIRWDGCKFLFTDLAKIWFLNFYLFFISQILLLLFGTSFEFI